MEMCARYLIYRLPEFREQIEQLMQENGDFRDLCHDYWLCLNCLWRWEILLEQDRERVKEYRALLEDLEMEVKRFLES